MTRCPVFLLGLLLMSSASFAQVPLPPPPVSVPGLPQLPPRDTAPKTGTARIRGRVVAADTGQPLRKAQVRATSAELRENRLATTDNNGVYEITELPAGRYQLTATKGSFVQLQYGQTRPFEAGKPLEVGDGQTDRQGRFQSAARRAHHRPRASTRSVRRPPRSRCRRCGIGYIQGRRQLVPAGRIATTNDIGEYRTFGLPPGQYYVVGDLRTGNPVRRRASSDRSGYAPTYYPGTANCLRSAAAHRRAGPDPQPASTWCWRPTRLARITGTAVDSAGKPMANGQIMMVQTRGAGVIDASRRQSVPTRRQLHDLERGAGGVHASGACSHVGAVLGSGSCRRRSRRPSRSPAKTSTDCGSSASSRPPSPDGSCCRRRRAGGIRAVVDSADRRRGAARADIDAGRGRLGRAG